MRYAWAMKLRPGEAEAYREKHDEIWPELVELIKSEGVQNFYIYRHGLTLFATYDRDTPPDRTSERPEIRQRWFEWMAPHMETNEDLSPVAEEVEEMFHLD